MGFLSKAFDAYLGRVEKNLPTKFKHKPGHAWSYDWCRFRSESRCYFPKELDVEGTRQAGYDVWIPLDRGICPRDKWDAQKACPVGEPGPKSCERLYYPDATRSWADGGQRRE